MGFAIAEAAAKAGHEVVLIAGPVALKTPKNITRVDVTSAREMLAAVKAALPADFFISTAAVADWRPAICSSTKLKKGAMFNVLELKRNPDILREIAKLKSGCRLIGFAAETGDPVAEATRKCREKGLEFIVANDVSEAGSGFGSATNRVTLIRKDGSSKAFPLMSKRLVAKHIISELAPTP